MSVDPQQWLKLRLDAGVDEELAHAAAQALAGREELLEDLKALDELTDLERELAVAAYNAGAAAALDEVDAAIGPAAITVDARTLINVVQSGRGRRPVDFNRPLAPLTYAQGDPRAAAIVAKARRRAIRDRTEPTV